VNGRTLIGSLGSLVMGDDGIGTRIMAMLEERCAFPESVDLVDIGTPGLGLMSYIIGYDKVILIDAVQDDGEPGDTAVYSREDILTRPLQNRVSPHDPAVTESLLTADMLGQPIEDVWLIGVIPENCKLNTEMTPTLNAKLQQIFEFTIITLREKGIDVHVKEELAV
jgi:hydrogenase maturation protease